MTRKIAVVTGSRADFGIMRCLLQDIEADEALQLQLIVTGTHLEEHYGSTINEIRSLQLPIAAEVPIDLAENDSASIARSMSLALSGMTSVFLDLQPDIVILLGDRFEIFASAQAAMLTGVPIGHIAGGDITEGAMDDVMRHAITKMSHLHFATNELSARRIAQLGEDPATIIISGNPSLDTLRREVLLERSTLENDLGRPLGKRNFIMTFHPVTLEDDLGVGQLDALLDVLDQMLEPSDVLWCTKSNADEGGAEINERIETWARGRLDVEVRTSLGHKRYLSLLEQCDLVIGNSSSGLYEAPSLKTPTLNIGNRQGGRLSPNSVFHASGKAEDIAHAFRQALHFETDLAENPFGDGYASERIIEKIKQVTNFKSLLKKRFHAVPMQAFPELSE